MKKVAILVLLSLSSCLSLTTETTASAGTNPEKASTPESLKSKEVSPVPAHKEQPTNINATEPNIKTSEKTTESVNNTTKQQTESKNTTTSSNSNNTTDKKEEKSPAPEKATSANTETKANETTEAAVKHETKPEDKPKNDVTTPKNEVTSKPNSTTEAPKQDGKEVPLQARGFDGPSFIGGIILTLGLLAIGFMGLKYYKNQTERNYHTL